MTALSLRLIACMAMLLDHIGYYEGIAVLRIIGRIAFPIFAYLIYNGYRHTSNKGRYALRLGLFALLSQVPFSLFTQNVLWRDNGNVFFTLLIALLCLWSADTMMRHKRLRWLSPVPGLVVFGLYILGILHSDYDAAGILLVLVFYYFDRKGWAWKLLQAAAFLCAVYYKYIVGVGIFLIKQLSGQQTQLPAFGLMDQYRICVLGGLVLIFLYNGKKGELPRWLSPKVVQYGFYLFYPLHQLVLWFLYCKVGVL